MQVVGLFKFPERLNFLDSRTVSDRHRLPEQFSGGSRGKHL